MTKEELRLAFAKLSAVEQHELVDELWRGLQAEPGVSIHRAQVEEAERRYDEFLAGSQTATEWPEVRRRVEARR